MTNKLRIHQQNLRKSSTATQDLLSNLEHSNTDLILIQEPHTNSNNKIMGFPSSSSMYQANSEIIPKTVRKLFKTYENVPLIVSGDFNARHTMWHNRITNKHGQLV
ncbi:hypothetical protein SSS_03096 [Sarcoptes scabiei]|uniref:Endonuclease/exonuclease/phosphatase domain-containing protein n=1 Tax=Sarcoptes scabiei TaxID=52283 RepID=A0A834R1I3_SARSC|nr:hypothetical protein SSS_03096 [Sarcoptes scabiei]